jgi:GT2 family glycosyltransferase
VIKTIRWLLNRLPWSSKLMRLLDQLLSITTILRAGVFDQEWYATQTRRSRSRFAACAHYVMWGRAAGLSPHPLFEPEFFDPDRWRKSSADPLARYLQSRKSWTEATHPLFDGSAYLAATPEAGEHRWGPLAHFVSVASPASILPVPRSADRQPAPTWSAARELIISQLAEWVHNDELRQTQRITPDYGRRRERRFLKQWGAAPLPQVGPGEPLVSVIMPTWNRREEVIKAIRSVKAQTLQNWELLVVDDGSTDGTASAIESIATDPRVRLLRQEHRGAAAARNLGNESAHGRYVAWLDSDNEWLPHRLHAAIAAMDGLGHEAAYVAMAMADDTKVGYRALDAGRDVLALQNNIDLNSLIVTRSLLGRVGSFDESLQRTVDYDLVLRLAKQTPIAYLPFVGVRYNNRSNDASRMTVSELASWLEVVQNNNLIDWRAQPARRVSGRVSVIIQTDDDWLHAVRCVQSVIGTADDLDVEIVVFDNGSRRAVTSVLAAVETTDSRVRLVQSPIDRHFALGSNLACAESTGEVVVFLSCDTEAQDGWLGPVIESLQDPSVLGAQPLLLYPSGTIECAGMVFPAQGVFPTRFLAGHPAEDARRMQEITVPAMSGGAFAVRAEDVIALRGFDPIYRYGLADVDFCLRLGKARSGRFRVVTESTVRYQEYDTATRRRQKPVSRRVFRDRWSGRLPDTGEELWARAGFTVSHYQLHRPSASQVGQPLVRPLVTRAVGIVADGPAKGLPAFRWAIKIAAPPDPEGRSWGDRYFAQALKQALEHLGQVVAVDARPAHYRASGYLDDVVLALRGLARVHRLDGRINLLWVISHPDLVEDDELTAFDEVFAASRPWSARKSEELGISVEPLLQCTDPTRFHPDVTPTGAGEPLLFVANSRRIFRPIVRDAIDEGFAPSIYGADWGEFVDPHLIRDTHLSNDELPAAYRSAGVVLNDHWDDMRREGFISNRLFDATAVGARVVSDDVPGLEEIFDGLVRTYRSPDELRTLLGSPPAEVFPAEAGRRELAESICREHSFTARAWTLLEYATRLWKA